MEKVSIRDIEHLKRDLEKALNGQRKGFYIALFEAMMQADSENMLKLEQCFPQEAALFKRYKEFGIDLSPEEMVV